MGSSEKKDRDGQYPSAEPLVVKHPDFYYYFTTNDVRSLQKLAAFCSFHPVLPMNEKNTVFKIKVKPMKFDSSI